MTRITLVFALVATAAAAPASLRKPPEVWGEEVDGLQAGLRMPGGTTAKAGGEAELQVVVRNVSRKPIAVKYDPQSEALYVIGVRAGDEVRVEVVYVDSPPDPTATPREVPLQPGEELVRWRWTVSPTTLHTAVGKEWKREEVPAGTYQFEMRSVCGELEDHLNSKPTALDRLATGVLNVTLK